MSGSCSTTFQNSSSLPYGLASISMTEPCLQENNLLHAKNDFSCRENMTNMDSNCCELVLVNKTKDRKTLKRLFCLGLYIFLY